MQLLPAIYHFPKQSDQKIDEIKKTLNKLLGLAPQNLKVDFLCKILLNEQPMYILAEMQVKPQDMAIRLLSYVCKIFSSSPIDVNKNTIPPPVYGFAFCMRDNNDNNDLI